MMSEWQLDPNPFDDLDKAREYILAQVGIKPYNVCVDDQSVLIQGDTKYMMNLIQDQSIDLIVTDPPYLIDYQSNQRVATEKFEKIANDKETNKDLISFYFKECFRILKNNSSIYCFCGWQTIDFFKLEFEKYFELKNIIVWNKNRHGQGDLQGAYASSYELILYGHKGRDTLRGYRYPDIITVNKVAPGNLIHPNEKPVDLLELLIQNSSDENNYVFDGFVGSGSTLLAAKNSKRRYLGIELNENYFELAKKRLRNQEISLL